MKEETLKKIFDTKIIAIVRGVGPKDILAVARALLAGGVSMMEVTFDYGKPEGVLETLESLAILREKTDGRVSPGVGTVLTAEEVENAARAGAKYIISPNVDPDVIAKTRELGLVSMPGAFTPTEIALAHKLGADIVKLFPAGLFGPDYIKAVRAPLGHIPMAAVGGVTAETIPGFLAAGICAFGVGSNLVSAKKVAAGDFASITETAKAMSARITGT